MKLQFSYNHIVRVHTEHAYVQHPYVVIHEADEFWKTLKGYLKFVGVTDIYFNHYVIELDNGMYIGYNDSRIFFGTKISKMSDSETIELNTP